MLYLTENKLMNNQWKQTSKVVIYKHTLCMFAFLIWQLSVEPCGMTILSRQNKSYKVNYKW